MSNDRPLSHALERLVTELREFAERQSKPHLLPRAGPPASAADVAAFEQAIGRGLPDWYREFLHLHDGYTHLAVGGSFLALDERPGNARVTADVETDDGVDVRDLVTQLDAAPRGPIEAIIVGQFNEPNEWLYLATPEVSETGAWALVHYEPDDQVYYSDLIEYLEHCSEEVRGRQAMLDRGKLPGAPSDR